MAEAPRPPRKVQSKGAPPPEFEASANLNKSNEGDLIHLTFKVPKEFKKDFRGVALDEEISMTDLLKRCFDAYKQSRYGITELRK